MHDVDAAEDEPTSERERSEEEAQWGASRGLSCRVTDRGLGEEPALRIESGGKRIRYGQSVEEEGESNDRYEVLAAPQEREWLEKGRGDCGEIRGKEGWTAVLQEGDIVPRPNRLKRRYGGQGPVDQMECRGNTIK